MNKKGISLLIIVIAVSVMLVLITTATVVGSGAISTANFDRYISNISSLSDNINYYYIKNNSLPITSQVVSNESLGKDFINSLILNSDLDNKLYVVDMSKIDDTTITGGKGSVSNKDVFVVAENTHNVYYLKGFKHKSKIYFSILPSDYSDVIDTPNVEYLSYTNNKLNIDTSRGTSIVKYAEGIKDLSYFQTNGDTVLNSYIDIADNTQVYTIYLKNKNNEEIVSHVSLPFKKTFANTATGNTGSYQTFNVPSNATYKIEAYGAAGSNGNRGTNTKSATGGKGAYVFGEFNLNLNDTLIMLVGQMGVLSTPSNSSGDGTSGGGGGASFVTKVTPTDTTYNLTAYSPNSYVTPLMVAAGGNGGNDFGRLTTLVNGADGIYEKGNINNGFSKFLNSPNGTTFTNISQTAFGGFGGASAFDDINGIGGGWTLGISNETSNTGSYSFNASTTTFGGQTGANAGQGYITITKTSLDKID